MISRDTVLHVASLAALSLGEDEIEPLSRDLDAIVRYVQQLGAVDTEGVPPMTSAAPGARGLRADEPAPGLTHEEALAQAPRVVDGSFAVPPFASRS